MDDYSFNNQFYTEILKKNKDFVSLRANIHDANGIERWKSLYCLNFKTTLNVVEKYARSPRFDCNHRYKCIFGDRRHKGTKKTFTGCPFKMSIKIKAKTKGTRRNDKHIDFQPCFITIQGQHNHSVDSAAALSQLRILPDTKEEFFQYFALGMTPPQAMRLHEEKFGLDLSIIANSAVNPKPRSIYHLHDTWLKKHHGNVGGQSMFQAIRDYAGKHPTSRIQVEGNEDKFTIVLVTEFMLRIHKELKEAGEIVFVDTTSHVDQLNTAVTVLLCAGPAGAAPLGVIFTSSQSEADYKAGFGMLKDILGEQGFYGKGCPDVILTDNSDPERNALKSVYPNAQQFLCVFHLLQQIWRWIYDGNHKILKEDRRPLMEVARNLVYAEDKISFDNLLNSYLQTPLAQKYEQYTRYLTKLSERRIEWSLAFRAGHPLRGHHTNNFAESTICILKDVILNRCKAYNVSQLVVYMNEVFNLYMQRRLLDLSLGRKKLKTLAKNNGNEFQVRQQDQSTFTVKSEKSNKFYNVDLTMGICDCFAGQTGSICKHQIACANESLQQLPQVFNSSKENRRWLAGVALGFEEVPGIDFFSDLIELPNQAENNVGGDEAVIASTSKISSSDEIAFEATPPTSSSAKSKEDILKEITNTMKRYNEMFDNDQTTDSLENFFKKLQNVKTGNAYCSVLSSSNSRLPGAGRGKIPCQPTSIARRATGMPRGAAVIGKGRKRKGSLILRAAKRARNLALNISQNQPNAKTH